MKLDLLTNATVVDDAIRFVSSNQYKVISASSSNQEDKDELREPDYDEDRDQLDEDCNGDLSRIQRRHR